MIENVTFDSPDELIVSFLGTPGPYIFFKSGTFLYMLLVSMTKTNIFSTYLHIGYSLDIHSSRIIHIFIY